MILHFKNKECLVAELNADLFVHWEIFKFSFLYKIDSEKEKRKQEAHLRYQREKDYYQKLFAQQIRDNFWFEAPLVLLYGLTNFYYLSETSTTNERIGDMIINWGRNQPAEVSPVYNDKTPRAHKSFPSTWWQVVEPIGPVFAGPSASPLGFKGGFIMPKLTETRPAPSQKKASLPLSGPHKKLQYFTQFQRAVRLAASENFSNAPSTGANPPNGQINSAISSPTVASALIPQAGQVDLNNFFEKFSEAYPTPTGDKYTIFTMEDQSVQAYNAFIKDYFIKNHPEAATAYQKGNISLTGEDRLQLHADHVMVATLLPKQPIIGLDNTFRYTDGYMKIKKFSDLSPRQKFIFRQNVREMIEGVDLSEIPAFRFFTEQQKNITPLVYGYMAGSWGFYDLLNPHAVFEHAHIYSDLWGCVDLQWMKLLMPGRFHGTMTEVERAMFTNTANKGGGFSIYSRAERASASMLADSIINQNPEILRSTTAGELARVLVPQVAQTPAVAPFSARFIAIQGMEGKEKLTALQTLLGQCVASGGFNDISTGVVKSSLITEIGAQLGESAYQEHISVMEKNAAILDVAPLLTASLKTEVRQRAIEAGVRLAKLAIAEAIKNS